jgi:hypothetical protein
MPDSAANTHLALKRKLGTRVIPIYVILYFCIQEVLYGKNLILVG